MFPSTISSWALVIWRALESYGCDSRGVFERAGLDARKLRDPNARYPFTAMTQLWGLAVDATGDPCFGLTAARFWHPTSMHALGYSWMASATLRDALERSVRYIRIVSTVAKVSLEESTEHCEFILDHTADNVLPADEAIDAAMAVILDLCRTSYGSELNPVRVALRRREPACAGEFARVFGAPVGFSAPKNIIYFGRTALDVRLPTANAELARANDQIITEYLAHLDRSEVTMQVKARLIDQLPSGHTAETSIAEAINLSPRTLQRKLQEEGTSYRELLDETRRELAAQYIENSRLSINEITYLLGFSEPSNFSRAFKRWMGVSPRAYRLSR